MTITTLPRKTNSTFANSNKWTLLIKPPINPHNDVRESTKYLQDSLNCMGFTDHEGKKLTVDGRAGGRTRTAVGKMKRAAGVPEENAMVSALSWLVIDEAMYTGWTAAPSAMTSLGARGPAIYRGCNRYTGIPVNTRGIPERIQQASDVGQLAHPQWGRYFVAVDRLTSTGATSLHRFGTARDWMTDVDKDGNFVEAAEVAGCQALIAQYVGRSAGWAMEDVVIPERGDGAKGINDSSAILRYRRYRYSGPDRFCRAIYRGYIWEWRLVNGSWTRGPFKLKTTSDQHWNHVHMEFAPLLNGNVLRE